MMNPALYQTLLNNMKLIDKDALVAEIERRIKSLRQVNSPREQAVLYECEDIISFLDTLEVKEVEDESYVISKTGSYNTSTK